MLATLQSFWLPKAGNSAEEYEDACWPSNAAPTDVTIEDSPLRAAVADGATETSFSRLWAELLVEAYGTYRFECGDSLIGLSDLRRKWRDQVDERTKDKSWAIVEKASQGAFAALAGLTLRRIPNEKILWRAAAVGDSCLMVRAEGKLHSFPLERSEEFDNRPVLLSSNPAGASAPDKDTVSTDSGMCRVPCTFYLLTDALACWFLSVHEDGQDPASMLDALDDCRQFEQLVQAQRQAADAQGRPALKNDDVTLLRIHIPSPEAGDAVAVER